MRSGALKLGAPGGVVEFWAVDLSAADAELVAQDDDLRVFGTTGTDGEPGQTGDEAVENVRHSRLASGRVCPAQPHDRIFGPHTVRRSDRNAAIATARASFGSFFWERPEPNTRTRDASNGGTSNTVSPAATSC